MYVPRVLNLYQINELVSLPKSLIEKNDDATITRGRKKTFV